MHTYATLGINVDLLMCALSKVMMHTFWRIACVAAMETGFKVFLACWIWSKVIVNVFSVVLLRMTVTLLQLNSGRDNFL